MAKWLCLCGAVIRSSGDIPNPAEWLSVSDVDFADFSGVIDAENLYGAMTHSFRCSKCGRFHVFWSGFDHDPVIYAVEATRQPEARDQGAQARVDSASRLASSAEWSDRATAGYLLSSEAGDDRVDAVLRRLLLDEQDTGVTFATARALLERRDAIGLQLVLEANLDAAEDTGQWLFDAVSKVRAGSEFDRTAPHCDPNWRRLNSRTSASPAWSLSCSHSSGRTDEDMHDWPDLTDAEVPSPRLVAAWLILDILPTERVPLWAAHWIADGHDGESLARLAGLSGKDPHDVRDLLGDALRDCGVEDRDVSPGATPKRASAMEAFTAVARLQVSGRASERWVVSKVYEIVEPDFDGEIIALPLGWLFGLDDEWSAGWGRTDDELRVEVRQACRDQLAVAYGSPGPALGTVRGKFENR